MRASRSNGTNNGILVYEVVCSVRVTRQIFDQRLFFFVQSFFFACAPHKHTHAVTKPFCCGWSSGWLASSSRVDMADDDGLGV